MKHNLKVMILGSTSFGGRCLIKKLLDKHFTVIGTSRSTENNKTFLPYYDHPNLFQFSHYQLDINKNITLLLELIDKEKPDIIVDFAGQGMVAQSWDFPEQWYNTNLVAKSKIHNHLKSVKYLSKYIRISTPEVYGSTDEIINETANYNPSTPYSISHAAIDMNLLAYNKNYNFPAIIARFANFYGSYQQLYRIVPKTFYCAMTKETLSLHGGGTSIRAFIHGYDVADGIILLIEKASPGEIFHFSTDKFLSIKDVVIKISKIIGIELEEFVKISEDRLGKDQAYLMSSEKAKKELGWSAKYSFDEGLLECFSWIKHNFKDIKNLPTNYVHKI
jgi:dTDP-glucose 4,6-dehydratase